jgi:hypothetical protein
MRRAILAVLALALAGCGGQDGPLRKTVTWHMDASGAPVCVDADHEADWTFSDGIHHHACWWDCVGHSAGGWKGIPMDDAEVVVDFTSTDGVTYTHVPGDGVGPGCR